MNKEFILDMQESYPFGQLGDVLTENTKVIVRKVLKFTNEQQREIIKQMIHFLKAARHQSLLNIQKILEGSGEIQLYYQYAPFKLEKWIASVNEEILGTLQEKMLQLAQYLGRSSIKFTFSPECIGLSSTMGVKYFLNQFSLDFQGQEQHNQQLISDIKKFFKEFSRYSGDKQEIEDNKHSTMLESLSTNPSISPFDQQITLTPTQTIKNQQKVSKKSSLSAKVQSSKLKSLQVLARFKRNASK